MDTGADPGAAFVSRLEHAAAAIAKRAADAANVRRERFDIEANK
jgi:hypothetical protein